MRLAVGLSTLAPTPLARIRIIAVVLLIPLKRRIPQWRHRLVAVTVGARPPGHRFFFSDRSELHALVEVFLDGAYALELGAAPRVIVDLGANVGQASLYFRDRYPDARIIAVEPDPLTFAALRRNLGDDPKTVLRQHAVTPRSGPVGLARSADESWATRVIEPGADEAVRGATLGEVLHEEGIDRVDLLKVDIEGLEIEVLADAPLLARIDTVVGELHDWALAGGPDEAVATMRQCGRFDHAALFDDWLFGLSRGTEPAWARDRVRGPWAAARADR